MSAGTKTKDQLAEIREQKTALLEEKATKMKAREDARAAFAGSVDPTDTESSEFKQAQNAIRQLSEVDEKLARTQEAEVMILELRGETLTYEDHPAGDPTDPRFTSAWDTSKVLTADKVSRLERLSQSSGGFGRFELGEVASRDALAAEIGTTTVGGLIQPDHRGLQPLTQRPLDILSLVASGTTSSNLIDYVQSVGINTGAQEVAEGALKPELALTFSDASAPVRTIAGWLKLRKQTLADAPALQSFVDTQIRYAVQRRLNDQIMAGNGVGENLRGILATTGVQTATVLGSDNLADRVLKGMTAILLSELAATGVALHPVDWQNLMLLRDAGGASANTGGYVFGGPASGVTTPRIWGLPAVPSQAIAQGTAVVGDFSQAQVMVRQGVEVLLSDSDQDDFVKNRVTLLGEMRAALLIWRPDAFAKVNLGAVA